MGYTVHRVAESDTTERLHFHFLSKSLQMVTAAMKLKDTPWKKSYDQPRQHVKKQSCVVPGMSGLHSCGEGERVITLESW